MQRTILVIGFLCASIIPVIITKPMYTLIHERAELLEYNETLVTKDVIFTFKKVNRTSFAFSTSFDLKEDITDRRVMMMLYIDKMYGTQYKRTGTKITINLCKFWEKNTFGMKEILQQHGNMEACNIIKGRYYVENFIPDENMFPKYLPYGSYRIDINIFHEDGAKLFRMYWFARVDQRVL